MALIEIKNVSVEFAGGKVKKQKAAGGAEPVAEPVAKNGRELVTAVADVSLDIEKGDIYGIIGYSGAGKSTLVRTINLLQAPTAGSVTIDGRAIYDSAKGGVQLKSRDLRQLRQGIGMIFQHFNLLNEKTVFDNVLFALRHSGLEKPQRRAKVSELLELVELTELAKAYPAQLSGGQKQRVAIARALANDPEILLSDEGTSALDPKTTNQILDLLKSLHERLGITIVLITHEMQVVKEIANKIAVMQNGRVIEHGSLLEIFGNPKEELTRQFISTTSSAKRFIDNIEKTTVLQDLSADEELIHLSYDGTALDEPIISDLSKQFALTASIYFGDVELLSGNPFGSLIVVLKGEAGVREQAKQYLREKKITFEELSHKNGGAA